MDPEAAKREEERDEVLPPQLPDRSMLHRLG